MLTGADPSCGSLAEGPVRRAGKHKTLYVIMRKMRFWAGFFVCHFEN
jgi:hypothetical protein